MFNLIYIKPKNRHFNLIFRFLFFNTRDFPAEFYFF